MSVQVADRRSRYLIEPRFQGKFILAFLSIASLYVLVQAFVFSHMIVNVAGELPQGEEMLLPAFFSGLKINLLVTLLVLVPLTVAIGTFLTFRVAGPLYRFRTYLGQIADGEYPGPCRIRKEDDLQDLCDVLNRAVERLRADAEAPAAEPAQESLDVEAVPSLTSASRTARKAQRVTGSTDAGPR